MKEYYQIIADEAALKEFIDWLPETNDDEKFYLALQARKKYAPNILKTSHDPQLKRFVARKNELFNKIRQLECPIGAYVTKDGIEIPNESLALYITVIPRDLKKASFTAVHDLVTLIQQDQRFNPYAEVLSSIHRSKGKSKLAHFDIDNEGDEEKKDFLDSIEEAIPSYIGDDAKFSIIETRGGCHVIIDTTTVNNKKNWYQHIKTMSDQDGDIMVPVVGCYQGGFVTKFHRK